MRNAYVREATLFVPEPGHDDIEEAAMVAAALSGAGVRVSDIFQLRRANTRTKAKEETPLRDISLSLASRSRGNAGKK